MRKENDPTVNQDLLTAHFQSQDKVAQKPKSRTRNMFHHYKLTGLEPHETILNHSVTRLVSLQPTMQSGDNYEPSIINTLPAAGERTAEGRIVWTFDSAMRSSQ